MTSRTAELRTFPAAAPTHMYEVVRRRAAMHPTAVAVGSEEGLRWRTYDSSELLSTVDRLAVELADQGVQEGDRVVLWVPNNARSVAFHFAVWKLGGVIVPFDREMNPEAGASIIQAVEPRLVIAGYGDRPSWAEQAADWWEPGSRVSAVPSDDWTQPDEELAAIFFTSGTTGNPKGCMLSHANIRSQLEALPDIIAADPSCRLASILPLSHVLELTCGMLYPLWRGSEVHYIPSRRPPDILRVFADQRITHMIAVPQLLTPMASALDEQLRSKLPGPIYRGMVALAERLPMRARRLLFFPVHRRLGGHLRFMLSGGAALPPDTQRQWELMGVRVIQGYGASECSPVISAGRETEDTPRGSVGRPLQEVQVRRESDGELHVKGPNVMRGYWKDSERTAEAVRDGWYATGDLGTIDDDGNIWLQGRSKDLIVLPSGLNVWPEDIEDVFRRHEAVKDVSVIGLPSAAGGMTLHAYLIPSAAEGDVQPIVAASNARLAQHQRVASASWWAEEDFPRTAGLGKVRRHLLPQPEASKVVEVDAALAEDDPVGQAVAAAAHAGRVRDEQTLGELGLDSLSLVDLALGLEEKTGKVVGDDDLQLEMTVTQVREMIVSAQGADRTARASAERRMSASQPIWPYTWGRWLRVLRFPISLLYRYAVTRTIVLGGDNLRDLPPRVILAGNHRSFPDFPLVHRALKMSPAKPLASRLIVAAGAAGFDTAGLAGMYGRLAFGLFPLRQYSDRDVSLRALAKLAGDGSPILIFPQGTHSRPEEEHRNDPRVRFKPGVAHLAAGLDAAVVPFGLAGTDTMMPAFQDEFDGYRFADVPVSIKRGPLAIAFGAPLTLDPEESMTAFAERLQGASYELMTQAEEASNKNPA